MDPLEQVLPDKDTTFAFMLEAIGRGHEAYFVALHDLYAVGSRAYAGARRCAVMRGTPHYRFLDEGAEYPLEAFDAIFMRKDPPADAAYLYATMLLSLADRGRTFILNEPAGLREANEKLYALNFPDAIPPTLVTEDIARLKRVPRRRRRPQPQRHPRSRHPLRIAADHGPALPRRNPRRRQAPDRARRRAARMHAARAARRRKPRQYPCRRQLRQGRGHRARPRHLRHDAAAP